MKNHTDIDWEYISESIAQRRYVAKSNTLPYGTLKDIADEEVMYFMNHEEDSLRAMRSRIAFRYKHKLAYIWEQKGTIWNGWREDPYFIYRYERDAKMAKAFNRSICRY